LLTPDIQGRGMRWRQTTNSGRDQVIEITAWYDKVGYQYKIVDGSPYAENMGRIKLHETPDGTEIIWEFQYEVAGPFGGLRNALATRRTLENNIAESLWQLWEYISSIPKEERDAWVAKSLMKDAPDVEARAAYQSRHQPSKTTPPSSVSLSEPPVTQDDTRPRPVVAPEPAAQQPGTIPDETVTEPDFLKNVTPDDLQPTDQSGDTFDIQEKTDTSEMHYLEFDATKPEPATEAPEWDAPTDPHLKVASDLVTNPPEREQTPAVNPETLSDGEPTTNEEAATQNTHDLRTTEILPTAKDPTESTPSTSDSDETADTAQVSVFELFGVQKPSETQESKAVRIDGTALDEEQNREDAFEDILTNTPAPANPEVTEVAEVAAAPTVQSTPKVDFIPPPLYTARTGLRLRLRQSLIRLRRPNNQ